jgi:arylsulfatase A-like enzyme
VLRRYQQYQAEGAGEADRPWALVCSFHGPHFPIEVPEPFASMYDPREVPQPGSFHDSFQGKPTGQATHPWLQLAAHLSWEEWQRVIAHYWGFVTYVDSLIGRVLDALEETGQTERTIVLATADHGEMAGHHRMFDKGPYLYEDVMRVPFVWRWPGQIVARQAPETRLASHVDTVPTLLALTGVPLAAGSPPLQGHELFTPHPLAPSPTRGEGEESHNGGTRYSPFPMVGEGKGVGETGDEDEQVAYGETNVADKVNPQLDTRMVVTQQWKYVFRPGDIDELYDLATDPDELRNLAGEPACAPVLSELRARLADWMHETEDVLPAPDHRALRTDN